MTSRLYKFKLVLFFQTTRVDDKESGYDKDTTVASDFAGDSSGVTFKHIY